MQRQCPVLRQRRVVPQWLATFRALLSQCSLPNACSMPGRVHLCDAATVCGRAHWLQRTVSVKKSRLTELKVNRSSQVNLRKVVILARFHCQGLKVPGSCAQIRPVAWQCLAAALSPLLLRLLRAGQPACWRSSLIKSL